jgi:methionine-rich copper-binding protein CopC
MEFRLHLNWKSHSVIPRRLATVLMAPVLLMPCILSAHAILVRSTPSENAVVSGPALSVELSFNSKVDQSRSTLALEASENNDAPIPIAVKKDSEQPAKPLAAISNLKQGSYKLRWQVLAIDGHITRGAIAFRVE